MYPLKNKLVTCHYARKKGQRYVCRMTGEMFTRLGDMRCTTQNECAELFCRGEFYTLPAHTIPNYAPIHSEEDFAVRSVEASGRRTRAAQDDDDGE